MDDKLKTSFLATKWCPDTPDFRDLAYHGNEATYLRQFVQQSDDGRTAVDLREKILPTMPLDDGVAASANACCSLIEYFRLNCENNPTRLSREFVHTFANLFDRTSEASHVSLRSAIRSMRFAGAPPYELVQHLRSTGREPLDSPICYAFANEFAGMQYFRINASNPIETIDRIKSLLRAGIPCVFGMSVPSSISSDPRIDLRIRYDSIAGFATGVMLGFDDAFRIANRGAFCFQCSSSPQWGDKGNGWLPYDYLLHSMVSDVWVVVRPSWLKNLEITCPAVVHGQNTACS